MREEARWLAMLDDAVAGQLRRSALGPVLVLPLVFVALAYSNVGGAVATVLWLFVWMLSVWTAALTRETAVSVASQFARLESPAPERAFARLSDPSAGVAYLAVGPLLGAAAAIVVLLQSEAPRAQEARDPAPLERDSRLKRSDSASVRPVGQENLTPIEPDVVPDSLVRMLDEVLAQARIWADYDGGAPRRTVAFLALVTLDRCEDVVALSDSNITALYCIRAAHATLDGYEVDCDELADLELRHLEFSRDPDCLVSPVLERPNSDRLQLQVDRAWASFLVGDTERAADHFDRVLRVEPEHPEANFGFGISTGSRDHWCLGRGFSSQNLDFFMEAARAVCLE